MKLVVAARRFPGLASSARSGGNSVRNPAARTWNTSTGVGRSRNRRGPRSTQIDAAEQTRRRLGQQDLTAMPGGHHPRRAIEHRTEVVAPAQLGFAGRQPHPHRQLQARCAATAASTAERGEANAAHTPSPVCLNNQPPCASIAWRSTSSWAASATRIPSASASHRRVEPSTSVNRNVTTPKEQPPQERTSLQNVTTERRTC